MEGALNHNHILPTAGVDARATSCFAADTSQLGILSGKWPDQADDYAAWTAATDNKKYTQGDIMLKPDQQFLMDQLADAARMGRVSRRSFMSTAMAAGITATTATGVWTSQAQAQPKSGGTYRCAQHDGNTSDTHDMGVYQSNFDISLVHTHRSFLTMINQDGSLGPDLAKEWSATEDAAEWTFVLQDSATFHSGAKVTANDVVASMNYHRGEDTGSAAKALLATVTDITDNGDNSVTFKLASGNADLPWLLTDYHLCIVPANADGTANWQSGDGSGPYKIEELEFGVGARLSRHDGWHGEGAYFDECEFTVINDPNARQTALITGDADSASLLESKTLGLMARNPDIEIDNVPSGQAITMPMHVDVAPFDVPEVRMALKLAINREELIEKITFGAATIGNDFHHSPAQPYFPGCRAAPVRSRPGEVASCERWHGRSDGELLHRRLDHDRCCRRRRALRRARQGCWHHSERGPRTERRLLVRRLAREAILHGDLGLASNAGRDVHAGLRSGSRLERIALEEPRFNELLLQAKGELDDAKRGEMYAEMAMLARDDGGTIIPYFPNFVYARRAELFCGARTVSPAWQMDGYRHASRWWFA